MRRGRGVSAHGRTASSVSDLDVSLITGGLAVCGPPPKHNCTCSSEILIGSPVGCPGYSRMWSGPSQSFEADKRKRRRGRKGEEEGGGETVFVVGYQLVSFIDGSTGSQMGMPTTAFNYCRTMIEGSCRGMRMMMQVQFGFGFVVINS